MGKKKHINKNLKVCFFGTSDRSVPILESLKNNLDLKLYITKKDTLFGRKQILKTTEVKRWARTNNISIYELNTLSDKVALDLIHTLNLQKIEYGIVTDFSFILPETLINHFDKKLINIHFSLLPKYRGASPLQFAIKNGDKKTGISFQLVDRKMDKGPILYQYEYNIPDNNTSGEVYDSMFRVTSEILPQVLNDYSFGNLQLKEQNEAEATYTYSSSHPKNTLIYKEDGKIDWNMSPKQIHNFARAYNPWPISWTTLDEFEKGYLEPQGFCLKNHIKKQLALKIYRTELNEKDKLNILELQIEGKKKTKWPDFVNGYIEIRG
ncbi:methionyl-tRNA formyltransferase [Patescibacteria group bacterium]|nr:methionyl-tRNA formyltransferase [Patescibacteria group bacterium]